MSGYKVVRVGVGVGVGAGIGVGIGVGVGVGVGIGVGVGVGVGVRVRVGELGLLALDACNEIGPLTGPGRAASAGAWQLAH